MVAPGGAVTTKNTIISCTNERTSLAQFAIIGSDMYLTRTFNLRYKNTRINWNIILMMSNKIVLDLGSLILEEGLSAYINPLLLFQRLGPNLKFKKN